MKYSVLIIFILLLLPVLVFINSGHFTPNYSMHIAHANAVDQIYTSLQAYYTDNRNYLIISDWEETLKECSENATCLYPYLKKEEFDGGPSTTYYYWVSKDLQSVLICVNTAFDDNPNKGDDYYCNGNGFDHYEVPGKIRKPSLTEKEFPIKGNWTLIQDWDNEMNQFITPSAL